MKELLSTSDFCRVLLLGKNQDITSFLRSRIDTTRKLLYNTSFNAVAEVSQLVDEIIRILENIDVFFSEEEFQSSSNEILGSQFHDFLIQNYRNINITDSIIFSELKQVKLADFLKKSVYNFITSFIYNNILTKLVLSRTLVRSIIFDKREVLSMLMFFWSKDQVSRFFSLEDSLTLTNNYPTLNEESLSKHATLCLSQIPIIREVLPKKSKISDFITPGFLDFIGYLNCVVKPTVDDSLESIIHHDTFQLIVSSYFIYREVNSSEESKREIKNILETFKKYEYFSTNDTLSNIITINSETVVDAIQKTYYVVSDKESFRKNVVGHRKASALHSSIFPHFEKLSWISPSISGDVIIKVIPEITQLIKELHLKKVKLPETLEKFIFDRRTIVDLKDLDSVIFSYNSKSKEIIEDRKHQELSIRLLDFLLKSKEVNK
jgi:hypothetical protein